MPMDKFYPPVISSSKSQPKVSAPKPETLNKLRQFARAYTYMQSLGEIGSIVLN